MKNNVVTIKNEAGDFIECRILFRVEDDRSNKNFIVYTCDELMENGDIKTYASKCDEDGNLEEVTKEEYKFLEKMLNSLQTEKEKE